MRLQRRDNVVADAAGVGDRRILAHPNALVNAPAQVLGKMTVDIAIDHHPRLIGV